MKGNNLKYVLLVFSSIFVLSGCQISNRDDSLSNNQIQLVTKTVTPPIEVYDIPQEPILLPVEADLPRDISKIVIKDDEYCRNVSEDKRDDFFWKNCTEHPVIENTNIYLGFDLENWENFQINLFRIREYSNTLREILHEVNRRILELKNSEKNNNE